LGSESQIEGWQEICRERKGRNVADDAATF
jgi:hypothetical protein